MRGALDKKRQAWDPALDRQIVDQSLLQLRVGKRWRRGSSSHVFHSVALHRAPLCERCGSLDADRQAAALLGCTTPLRARDEQIYVV